MTIPAPEPAPSARGPLALPVGNAELVGREREWAALERALERAARATELVLVSGEPGVGKSRLVADFAARATGRRVLRGGAYEAQGQPPYVLFVEILRSYLEQPDVSGRHGAHPFGPLARLLPELDADEPGGPLSLADRQRLLELTATFFRTLALEMPLLLVLEDLHWADPASLELLSYLRRRLRDAPLLMLATYRHTDVDDRHTLTATLGELHRRRLAEELRLRPFVEAETAELLRALLGESAAPDLVAQIHHASEGNPFFIEELVRALAADERLRAGAGGWQSVGTAAQSADSALPPTLRAWLSARLHQLSVPARSLLEAASVLGRRFDPVVPATMEGLSEGQAAQLFEEATRRYVLRAHGQSYEFSHDLLRTALDLQIDPLHRRRLHQRAGEAYEALGFAGHRPAEMAYHLIRGPEPARARPYAARAGERALTTFAFTDGVTHLRTAVELTYQQGPANELPVLLGRLGDALVGAGRYDEGLTAYHEALALAAADRELMGRLHARVGHVHQAREEVDLAANAFRRALGAFGRSDHPEAGHTLLQLAELELVALSRHAQGAALARRALAMGGRLGRPELTAEARGVLGTAEVRMGRPTGARTLRRALDEALLHGEAPLVGRIANRLAQHHYWSAELEQAAHAAKQALSLLHGMAAPHLLGWPTFWAGVVAFTQGRWDEAELRASELLELGDQLGVRRFLAQGYQIRGMTAQDQGRRREAAEQLGRAASLLRTIAPGTLVFYLGRHCLALIEAGATAEGEACLAELESMALALEPGSKPRNSGLNMVALAYLELGRPDEGQRLERDLRPAVGQLHWTLVARTLGELSLARGEVDAAAEFLRLAARLATQGGARPELARTWRAMARLKRARPRLEESDRVKLAELDRQAGELERALGLSPPTPPQRGLPTRHSAATSLSRRELEVLRLVAEGRSNREIADHLVISERTAVHHVSHILDKLDVPSRAAAAAFAFRHGLLSDLAAGSQE